MTATIEPFPGLRAVTGLVQGVTTRATGASRGPYGRCNLGLGTEDDREAVTANRRAVAAALGVEKLVLPRQVHGTAVRVASADDTPGDCDALLLLAPGLAVGVLGADCPGLLLVDPTRRVLAVVHAGWRGMAGGIVVETLAALETTCGTTPADLHVGIGPGISGARYEVSAEVGDQIAAAVPRASRDDVVRPGRPGHAQADLVEGLHRQLVAAGVPATRIERHGACTFDDERFYSHRQDAGRTGRHAVVAAWR